MLLLLLLLHIMLKSTHKLCDKKYYLFITCTQRDVTPNRSHSRKRQSTNIPFSFVYSLSSLSIQTRNPLFEWNFVDFEFFFRRSKTLSLVFSLSKNSMCSHFCIPMFVRKLISQRPLVEISEWNSKFDFLLYVTFTLGHRNFPIYAAHACASTPPNTIARIDKGKWCLALRSTCTHVYVSLQCKCSTAWFSPVMFCVDMPCKKKPMHDGYESAHHSWFTDIMLLRVQCTSTRITYASPRACATFGHIL